MLQVAMADRGGSDYERAIGNRFADGFEFFRICQ